MRLSSIGVTPRIGLSVSDVPEDYVLIREFRIELGAINREDLPGFLNRHRVIGADLHEPGPPDPCVHTLR